VSRTCAVPGCREPRKGDQVMCAPHWYRVPRPVRLRLWEEYRKEPGSSAHRAAIHDAIASVADGGAP
jgi:hypothetical protein